MVRELSDRTEKALEQIASGWGRKPTVAHPACSCTPGDDGHRHNGRVTKEAKARCVVHGRTN